MLKIGDVIPDFTLTNQDNEPINLSDYRGKKIVLFAFPMAGTPNCTKQACIYRDTYDHFAENNTVIFGITSSPPTALRKWRDHHGFPYDMLSDLQGTTLDELGVWEQYSFQGIDDIYARRSYWIIDEQGVIQEAKINVEAENSVYESLEFIVEQANAVAAD